VHQTPVASGGEPRAQRNAGKCLQPKKHEHDDGKRREHPGRKCHVHTGLLFLPRLLASRLLCSGLFANSLASDLFGFASALLFLSLRPDRGRLRATLNRHCERDYFRSTFLGSTGFCLLRWISISSLGLLRGWSSVSGAATGIIPGSSPRTACVHLSNDPDLRRFGRFLIGGRAEVVSYDDGQAEHESRRGDRQHPLFSKARRSEVVRNRDVAFN